MNQNEIDEPRRLSAYGNVKIRRRKPKRNRFGKVIIIIASVLFVITLISGVLFWKYLELYSDCTPDRFVSNLVAKTDADGWKQLLRKYLGGSYAEYENASELAYKVLSPAFNIGKVTYIANSGTVKPEYTFFSNGTEFATLTLEDTGGIGFGLATWDIEAIDFDISFFTSVDFPETVIICPADGVLEINGVEINAENTPTEEACGYPDLSLGEGSSGPACVKRVFDDIWFEPAVKCTLDGVELKCVTAENTESRREYYFEFPESSIHSITVTVPSGVSAYVGEQLLTEEWAKLELIEGKLGELDDGGTGTLPILKVWTVEGLFAEPAVRAEVYGKEVKLISSEGGNYIFDTPEECKYTVTVIVPHGAEIALNGKTVDASKCQKLEDAEAGLGNTVFGRYDVSDLSVIPDAFPQFDKYVLTGYLAEPNVEAKLGDTVLEPCSKTTDEYTVVWEFDYLPEDKSSVAKARVNEAEDFFEAYIQYYCEGGAWDNPENSKTFQENYDRLIALMIPGTAGYSAVMESYRTVNMLPHYDSYKIKELGYSDYLEYTEKCISCKVTCSVNRKITVGGVKTEETVEIGMKVLQVLYKGEWRIWGFVTE